MIHELREYTAVPGPRPDLGVGFRDHTFELVPEHDTGVTFSGPPGAGAGPTSASPAGPDATGAAFTADPTWRAVKRAGEVDDPLGAGVGLRVAEPLA